MTFKTGDGLVDVDSDNLEVSDDSVFYGTATFLGPVNIPVGPVAGAVTVVTASSPLFSSGGSTPNISISSSTGTGAIVLATSPTLTNPILNTSNTILGGGLNRNVALRCKGAIEPHILLGSDFSDNSNFGYLSFIEDVKEFTLGMYNSSAKFYIDSAGRWALLADSNISICSMRGAVSLDGSLNINTLSANSVVTTNGDQTLVSISGTNGQILTLVAGAPTWAAPATSVTSVAMTVPPILSVSGSPITSSGTLAITTATAPTGTGAIVLETSPTLTNPILNTSNTILGGGLNTNVALRCTGAIEPHILLGSDFSDNSNFGYLSFIEDVKQFTLGMYNSSAKFYIDSAGRWALFADSNISLCSMRGEVYLDGSLNINTLSANSVVTTNGDKTLVSISGTNGQILTLVAGTPTWATPAPSGTVTSVAMTVPSILSVSGSPITSSGTLAITTAVAPTGTGAIVLATSPTLTTPNIGVATGTSLQLSSLTVSSAVATDASKNLVSIANTGTGSNVLASSPTLTTPNIGVATGTSITLTASSVCARFGPTVLASTQITVQGSTTQLVDIAVAGNATNYSTSSLAGDGVIRVMGGGRLLLQTGDQTAGILIASASTTISSPLSVTASSVCATFGPAASAATSIILRGSSTRYTEIGVAAGVNQYSDNATTGDVVVRNFSGNIILQRGAAGYGLMVTDTRTFVAGNLGIGTTTANAQIQVASTTANRKIVLFEVANNDHQYFGLGINSGIFRYQVPNTVDAHVFYAATGAAASNELARITGTGNLIVSGTITAAGMTSTSTLNMGLNRIEMTADSYLEYVGADGGVRLNGTTGGRFLTNNQNIFNYNSTNVNFNRQVDTYGTIALFAHTGVIVAESNLQLNISIRSDTGTVVGSITNNGANASFNTSSDYRLKKDVRPIANAISKISKLKPVTYKFIENDIQAEGFLAHELQKVLPYAVNGEKDGEIMQSVDYSKLTPILVAAVQELYSLFTNS